MKFKGNGIVWNPGTARPLVDFNETEFFETESTSEIKLLKSSGQAIPYFEQAGWPEEDDGIDAPERVKAPDGREGRIEIEIEDPKKEPIDDGLDDNDGLAVDQEAGSKQEENSALTRIEIMRALDEAKITYSSRMSKNELMELFLSIQV